MVEGWKLTFHKLGGPKSCRHEFKINPKPQTFVRGRKDRTTNSDLNDK